MKYGSISLLSNRYSELYILAAAKVPKSPSGESNARWLSYPPGRRRFPTAAEMNYVIWANSSAKDMELPSDHEFQERKAQSVNIRDKFTLLKDANAGNFYNLIGEVRKVYDSSGSLTVYLSDYTANSSFYNYPWGGTVDDEGRDGDEYGYIKSKKTAKDWPGPYGKLTIQLTLYDEHAEFVREYIKVEEWILLKNVQIKYGKIGGVLEGFLRGDQGKVGVEIMKQATEPEANDVRWVEAVKRKREYQKKAEQQQQDIQNEAAASGDKRNHDGDEPARNNSKKRRHDKRVAAEKKVAAADAKARKQLDLNENGKHCAIPEIRDILTAEQFGARSQMNQP
jgi:protection-of-telomeres protein 1